MEIPRADHLVFFGEALPVTMGHIDDWIARNHVLANAIGDGQRLALYRLGVPEHLAPKRCGRG